MRVTILYGDGRYVGSEGGFSPIVVQRSVSVIVSDEYASLDTLRICEAAREAIEGPILGIIKSEDPLTNDLLMAFAGRRNLRPLRFGDAVVVERGERYVLTHGGWRR